MSKQTGTNELHQYLAIEWFVFCRVASGCAGLCGESRHSPHPTPTSLAQKLFRSPTLGPIRLNFVLRFEKGLFHDSK